MKRIIFSIALVAFALITNGQSLHRDNLLGIHVMDVKLNPGVSLEAFTEFFVSEVIPEYEKHWLGLKGHIVQSVRGEYKGKLAIIWVFATEPTRDYYFNADGTMHEREIASLEKVKPIEEELKKRFGTYTVDYKDDWVVQ
ncbi:MAG: hypothetical protein R2788_23840 [Saprospiraceae bacterium]